MATYNTLYDFYTAQGKSLPTVTERSKLYEQYGLGSASTYGGTAAQNTALLGKLQTPVPQTMESQLAAIQQQANQMFSNVANQGVTDKSGNVLLPATSLGENPNISLNTGATNYNNANITTPAMTTVASTDAMTEWMKQQYEAQQKQLDAQQKAQQTQQTAMTDYINTQTANMANLTSGQNAIIAANQDKITALLPQLETLQTELNNLKTAEQTEIMNISSNPQYSVQYASREANRVSREYAIKQSGVSAELGVKTALMQAYQGNIETARNLVSDIVDQMQYKDNLVLTGINSFMENNQTFINTLNNNQQNLLNDIQGYWTNKTAQDKKDYTDKLNLVVEYGLNLTADDIKKMTLEQIAAKASGVVKSGLTPAQKAEQAEISNITTTLKASRGEDGYIDPDIYLAQRRKSTLSPGEFDNRFSDLLSPQERSRLGISSVPAKKELTADELGIVNDAKARLDKAKMMYEDYTAVRNQIIEQAKQQYNFDLSLYI